MTYDTNNVFAKIIRGMIPCNKVYEDDFTLAFHDASPQAPIHVLIIPKGAYRDADEFSQKASEPEMTSLIRAISKVAAAVGLTEYRLITNKGEDAGQEVPHFHIHLCGGRALGKILASAN